MTAPAAFGLPSADTLKTPSRRLYIPFPQILYTAAVSSLYDAVDMRDVRDYDGLETKVCFLN
jgi:hypothetical protein